jgi:hypothetical protein
MINNGVEYWNNHCYHVQQTNSIIFHFGSVVSEDKINHWPLIPYNIHIETNQWSL